MSTYYVAYEDKGPSGACGQSCSNTMPWRILYVFKDEVKAREFMEEVNTGKLRRMSPKILGFWSDDEFYNNVREV